MKHTLSLSLLFVSFASLSQERFSHQDTIRGSITHERAWWDVLKYDISVQPNYAAKTIKGSNTILFKTLKAGQVMQIDLQLPMEIESAVYGGQPVTFKRDSNAYYLDFGKMISEGVMGSVIINFSGKPKEAMRPPWDGGWIWAKDKLGRPWMSVACQGLGASVWYPCKDHQSDEPDQGATISVTVSDSLVAVANGKLIMSNPEDNGLMTYTWTVVNPINNYNIIPYIGKYVHWNEIYMGEKDSLNCDYWVLDYDLEKAKKQFQQVPKMLKCFEHWFGPYPFYEDGFKLVQSPHLGMEHQSAVAYGNKFANGYLGTDLSNTGWGLKWDFIIVHESGHEWFGNNITSKDLADMWIHESFTNYSETLFTTCEYGVNAGNEYVIGTRKQITNDAPIIPAYGVNTEGSGDMYYKGGNMLHTIRQLVNNDEKFRGILRGLNEKFRLKTVTAQEVENYVSANAGIDLSKVFEQYLTTTKIPVLRYKVEGRSLSYRWTNVVDGFSMKLKLADGTWLSPSTTWKKLRATAASTLTVDKNFYVEVKKVTP
ncbi:MAG: M1 family metallopeptidase [Chryseolinea sp.]